MSRRGDRIRRRNVFGSNEQRVEKRSSNDKDDGDDQVHQSRLAVSFSIRSWYRFSTAGSTSAAAAAACLWSLRTNSQMTIKPKPMAMYGMVHASSVKPSLGGTASA